jgi:hypothetical protein
MFSCKRRGICSSCGARRLAESAALLVDEVLTHGPMRQWVLSFPFQLRFLFASRPELMGKVLGIAYRAIAGQLVKKAGFTRKRAQTGAVILIHRFGSALNLNVHFHIAIGPQQGRKVFTLQNMPAVEDSRFSWKSRVLNRLRPDRWMIPVDSALSFLR